MSEFVYSENAWGGETPVYKDDDIDDIMSRLEEVKMMISDKIHELNELLKSLNEYYHASKKAIAAADHANKTAEEYDVFYELVKKELDLMAKISCVQDALSNMYNLKDKLF